MTEACIDPTRSAFEAFKALPRDEPLAMLNLVRFRDRAEYEAGHALAGAGLTGAEAYANYGRDSAPVFSKLSIISRCTTSGARSTQRAIGKYCNCRGLGFTAMRSVLTEASAVGSSTTSWLSTEGMAAGKVLFGVRA